jgi:ribonucleoside-diphosphate reductase alpha chain
MRDKYAHVNKNGETENWNNIAYRVSKHVLKSVGAPKSLIEETHGIISQRKFIPGGRYLYSAGRPYHQCQNCALFRAEDSREGWSDLWYRAGLALMTGAGIGCEYSLLRGKGKPVRKTGGIASGPLSLMQSINEVGRAIVNGGNRRCAIWAGLNWQHPDIQEFITAKNWIPEVRAMKLKDFNFPAMLDSTNISVGLDDTFFKAFHDDKHELHSSAQSVYWTTIRQMLKTGEPGFSINIGENSHEVLRNACTEITSADDSDICNLGSINLARIESLEEMERVTEIATAFLLAGTVYSDVPFAKIDLVRSKNRRLGLGLMGMHEWLLTHGHRYEVSEDLKKYLEIYTHSGRYAKKYAKQWDLSNPVKTRAIAPTGTIGIVAETSTGVEPIFCVAYKRRYRKGDSWNYEYVVDPTAKKLIEGGIPEDKIEDAYSLASDVERRVKFQADVQSYVDHGVSSTINLPTLGSELNNDTTVVTFGNMLIKYLPKLRGITCYPDGSRGGQPLTAVNYSTAAQHVGNVFYESGDVCDMAKGESCGS